MKHKFIALVKIFKLYRNPITCLFDKLFVKAREKIMIAELRNGLMFKLHTGNSDINTITEVFGTPGYENFLGKILPNSIFVDIGANIGSVSVGAAQKIKTGKVFAFEPNRELHPLLNENIALNKFKEQISVFDLGVAGMTGNYSMNFRSGDWGGASIKSDGSSTSGAKEFNIRCVSLHDLFDVCRISHIDFLKIDVEGAEYDILQNTSEENLQRIDFIFVEYHEPRVSKDAIKGLLERAGFNVSQVEGLPAFFAHRN